MQKLSEVMRDYFRDERLLLEARDVPVRVEKSDWQIKEGPERLSRSFEFDSENKLRYFVDEVLSFQKGFGHHGRLIIDKSQVTVDVYTHNIERVTGIDKEYAKACDDIYEDISHYGE